MKGCRVKTSGKSTSAGGHNHIVGSGKSGDAVQQNHHILLMLHQSLGTLNDHLGHSLMMLRQFIKGRIDDLHILTDDGLLNVRYLLRSLVDQKNQHMHLGVGVKDRLRHFLQQGSLTGLRRRNDHSSLSLTHRTDQIGHTHGNTAAGALQLNALIRENRSHLIKGTALYSFLRRITVDRLDI